MNVMTYTHIRATILARQVNMRIRFALGKLLATLLATAWLVGLGCAAARSDVWPDRTVVPTGPSTAPALQNPGFECKVGYVTQDGIKRRVPLGWTGVLMSGTPQLDSVRIRWDPGGCNGSGWVEHLKGEDNLVFVAQDLETPPAPRKPFDAAVYQQVAVIPGTAYSLSGWMVSLCGGSATPSSCPTGYYMEKLLGIDPTGGADPLGPNVLWVSDRRNFTESRWANLRLAVTAETDVLTVFGRIRSPFQWHGNHAFVDAFSLVRAPTAYFVNSPALISSTEARVQWDGVQSPDVQAIPNGQYHLFFDVQYRIGSQGDWIDWLTDQAAGSATFTASRCAGERSYAFRVRSRAEQINGVGAFPNHRYPGVWSEPAPIVFTPQTVCVPRAYLPLVLR
jgi:hypothetical protein